MRYNKYILKREGGHLSTKQGIADLKASLNTHLGQGVSLKANSGRKKIVEHTGVLESTYPNLFVVNVSDSTTNRKLSFSYVDVLTGNVGLTFEGQEQPLLVNRV